MLFFLPLIIFVIPAIASEKTIGVIMPGEAKYYKDMHNAFMSRLNREGYGVSVKIIVQKPYPDHISMRNAVRKLIAMDVDLIVAYGAAAIYAAIDEKANKPIVYAGLYDPLTRDITAKNITGVSMKIPISSLLRYLNEIKHISSLGVAYYMYEQDSVLQLKEIIHFSDQYKFKVETINVQNPYDVIGLSNQILGKSLDAILITSSSNASVASPAIMDISRNRKIPTASLLPGHGALPVIALFNAPEGQGVMAADKAIKIINGTPPHQIKRDSIADIELVFNIKEAINIGLKIPLNLVTEATRIVE